MQCFVFARRIPALVMAALCASGCGTPAKMSPDQLASKGIADGAAYWDVEQKLAREGYQCFVSGARREAFDCTKTMGVFPTCLLRIEFIADEENRVSHLRVANPACIGTP